MDMDDASPKRSQVEFDWRTTRRAALVLGGAIMLVVSFYEEENWRGKQAWERCRRELEARGQVLEWAAYIPAAVPDEQNIFKAPNMADWFIKGGRGALSGWLGFESMVGGVSSIRSAGTRPTTAGKSGDPKAASLTG